MDTKLELAVSNVVGGGWGGGGWGGGGGGGDFTAAHLSPLPHFPVIVSCVE
jgi:hypothetical protein